MHKCNILLISFLIVQLLGCNSNPHATSSSSSSSLKKELSFYASFDNGVKADYALGDANMYTAKGSYVDMKRQLDSIQIGMHNTDHKIIKGKGKFGDAFEFKYEKGRPIVYYKSKNNVAYNSENWSGSISFWLNVDPAKELGWYTDPIQITDVNFNDASIWVDFTDHEPPHFRLGVIGDKSAWSLDTLENPFKEEFEKRIIIVEEASFSRSQWTHVLITYKNLGSMKSLAKLYLNGILKGEVKGIDDPFTWDIDASNIYLGLGFNGGMDELAIFKNPLTEDQVMELYQLKEGIRSIF
ncbi:MAG: LamG-like jellyroll fold domain-containing protein [Bacteroidota bacterium]